MLDVRNLFHSEPYIDAGVEGLIDDMDVFWSAQVTIELDIRGIIVLIRV